MTDPRQFDDRPEETVARKLVSRTLLGLLVISVAFPPCHCLMGAYYIAPIARTSVTAATFSWLYRRYRRQLAGARVVSDAIQRALLRPLPPRIGGLALASVYRAAGGKDRIGGDLYAVARTDAATRVIIGDVRGKGLSSFLDVIAILGAFREWAPQPLSLTELSSRVEESFLRHVADGDAVSDAEERFATALILEVADLEPVARMVNYGHPPPVRARPGEVAVLPDTSCPPLGLTSLCDVRAHESTFELGPRDTLLLYTDGLIEARDCAGVCFPLLERAATWTWNDRLKPCRLGSVLGEILDDLIAHAGALPADDLAMIALARRSHGDGDRDGGGSALLPRPAPPDCSPDAGSKRWD